MIFHLHSISKKTFDSCYNIITIDGFINNKPINISFPFYFNKDNVDNIITEFKNELNISNIHNFKLFYKYLLLFSKKNRFHSISNIL